MGASNAYRYYRRQPDLKLTSHFDLVDICNADVDEFAMPVDEDCRRHSLSHSLRKPDFTATYQECDAPMNDHSGCRAAYERPIVVIERPPMA